MSYCRSEGKDGKDKIIFATAEDHATESTVKLPEPEEAPGLILPNGEINWNCPCLGGMATGPCGVEFREAFSCFHVSEADPKGSDCIEAFASMQECMLKYPEIYDKKSEGRDGDDEEEDPMDKLAAESSASKTQNSDEKPAQQDAKKD
ncbi:Hypothetical predicted protein [Cloeon dipterum]|uniref:CHCH domain-containing protein n=1 Tax=Cloeon dipterum TaxID=197152 RepID=A0A8S1E040_9INSE|nr:Hypothetical predicted protein [Cloeon dipterum]